MNIHGMLINGLIANHFDDYYRELGREKRVNQQNKRKRKNGKVKRLIIMIETLNNQTALLVSINLLFINVTNVDSS